MAKREILSWSCEERDSRECRNAHGCHCREITDLLARVAARDARIAKLEKRPVPVPA